jgi:hypothetical protein
MFRADWIWGKLDIYSALLSSTYQAELSIVVCWFRCVVNYWCCWPPLWSSYQSSWLENRDVLCFLWGTNWIYICYVEESRPPLWTSGQSSWLHNEDVLCFLWGTNWMYICHVEENRPPLWSSGQSSWLHNGDVLCFLWDANWIYVCCVGKRKINLNYSLLNNCDSQGYNFETLGCFYGLKYDTYTAHIKKHVTVLIVWQNGFPRTAYSSNYKSFQTCSLHPLRLAIRTKWINIVKYRLKVSDYPVLITCSNSYISG